MSNWIRCHNGSLLNVNNIIMLKVHKGNCVVQAECVGNRTVDIEQCGDRDEAKARQYEIAEVALEKKKAPTKPKVQQPKAKPAPKAPRKKK